MTTFVDTNVLVYARDGADREKQQRAQAWLDWLWSSGTGRLSVQVLSEYYVTVTRKLVPGMSPAAARADVADLAAWRPQPVTAELVRTAWDLEDRLALSYWDALIVAAASASGCSRLLSEDLQDGQQIDGVVVVNPFTNVPDDVGDQRRSDP